MPIYFFNHTNVYWQRKAHCMKGQTNTSVAEFRVLIIDDQSLVHDALKKNLTNFGFIHIHSATNAHYALQLCEEESFDFIFLSFNVSSDKDGFHLYEELKFCGHINAQTTVIFLSADTSQDLVNSIVELEPDDFWSKPLDSKKIIDRVSYLINARKRLKKLYELVDKQQFAAAIYTAERNLSRQELEDYHPKIKRIIGKSLFKLHQFEEAERYYRNLLQVHDYSWLHIELCRSLLKLKKEQEAEQLLATLFIREDTCFAAYDLIASHCIDEERFEDAYNYIKRASLLAPRNINRNKKLWDLARLNHDRLGQYKATINIYKQAKNSIHDSPHLQLNVIRSAIDLASASSKNEAAVLFKNAHGMFEQMQQYEQAIKSYEKALEKNPNLQDAKDNIEKIKQQQKDQEQQQKQQNNEQSQSDDSQNEQSKNQENQQSQNQQNKDNQQPDDSQNSDSQNEQSENQENQSESKPENKSQEQQANEDEQKQQEQQQKSAEQTEEQSKEGEEKTPAQIAAEQQAKETEQKHQQLLNKVTDDPYLLLRNKMQLEYQKRKQDGTTRGVKKQW